MGNVLFGAPIYSDDNETYTPSYSGGSWSSSLPLSNLKDRRLSKVARSSNALAASTTFSVDLGVARACRVFSIPKHNLSTAATIRVRGSSSAFSSWVPTDVSGLRFQLKASTHAGSADGAALATWTGSVSSVDGTQATGTRQPTKQTVSGKTVVRFDGSNDVMEVNLNLQNTATWYVAYANRTGTDGSFFGGCAAGSYVARGNTPFQANALITHSDGTPGITPSGGTTLNASSRLIAVYNYTTDNYEIFIDGVSKGTAAAAAIVDTASIISIGAGYGAFLAGDIYEIGCYDSTLSGANVTNLDTYLNNEYGASAYVYDSGTVDVYHDDAAITAEELAEMEAQGFNPGYTLVPSTAQTARYWKVEISDTANADGCVELGRMIIAGGWQPTLNMSYGAKLGFETSSTRTETDGGAMVYDERARRRVFNCVIEGLPEAEAFTEAFDMQRLLGTTRQLMFVFDPSDTAHMHRRAFLAVMKELSALDFPYYGRNTVPVSLVEEL